MEDELTIPISTIYAEELELDEVGIEIVDGDDDVLTIEYYPNQSLYNISCSDRVSTSAVEITPEQAWDLARRIISTELNKTLKDID